MDRLALILEVDPIFFDSPFCRIHDHKDRAGIGNAAVRGALPP
jgi:hypothetical protein